MLNLNVSKSTWVTCFILIVLGMVFYWFITSYTKIFYERDAGYSQEAKRNPFLALEKFVESYAISYESRKDFQLFDQSPGQYDTIFINNSRIAMPESVRQQMKRWVSQGGHLVLLATEYYDVNTATSRDRFLDELGVRFYKNEMDTYDIGEDDTISKMTFQDDIQETQVDFDPSSGYLHDNSGKATFLGGNNFADYMLQYPLDEGLITVLTDFSIWSNSFVENHDNALFFLQLAGNSEKVWFIYNRIQPSLIDLAIDKVPYVVISLVSLLILLLASNLWRQGVLHQDEKPVTREILKHILAAARFSYRLDKGENLVKNMRESLFYRINLSAIGFARLSDEKKLQRLAEITHIEKQKLELIWQDNNESYEEFMSKAKLIQQLRRQL